LTPSAAVVRTVP